MIQIEGECFIFEAYRGAVHSKKGKKFHLKVKPIRYGLLKGKSKLIYDWRFEAYNLVKDKFEIINIYKNPNRKMKVESDLLRKYMKKVKEFIKLSKRYFKQKSILSKEDIEKLKSLGYIKK